MIITLIKWALVIAVVYSVFIFIDSGQKEYGIVVESIQDNMPSMKSFFKEAIEKLDDK